MMRTMLFSILEDEDHCLEASILLTKIQSLNISSNYFQRASIRSASVNHCLKTNFVNAVIHGVFVLRNSL